ncbi:MAG: VOC family protein [Bacteroidia bacterium]|nr:VOC family protein [Bacteroidia bacterium]
MKTPMVTVLALVIGIAIGYGIHWFTKGATSIKNDTPAQVEQESNRVNGIGGIFFKTEDPNRLKQWYSKHLGLNVDDYGTNFEWRHASDSTQKGFTLWAPFSSKSTYFDGPLMINYRVSDLDGLLEKLKEEGVTVVDVMEPVEYGKFAHILDIDGNKVELWESYDDKYDEIVDGRTR